MSGSSKKFPKGATKIAAYLAAIFVAPGSLLLGGAFPPPDPLRRSAPELSVIPNQQIINSLQNEPVCFDAGSFYKTLNCKLLLETPSRDNATLPLYCQYS